MNRQGRRVRGGRVEGIEGRGDTGKKERAKKRQRWGSNERGRWEAGWQGRRNGDGAKRAVRTEREIRTTRGRKEGRMNERYKHTTNARNSYLMALSFSSTDSQRWRSSLNSRSSRKKETITLTITYLTDKTYLGSSSN